MWRRTAWYSAVAVLVAAAVVLHVYQIADLPRGFYPDESSIGYNAWMIATTGRDEHGIAWPLYFRAFGEYKNPVYIYLLALIYELLGLSEWTTRVASAFCWLAGSAALAALAWQLFEERTVRLYVLVCLAFTPWLFAVSRISFELISAYPLLALHLLSVQRARQERSVPWAIVAGGSVGIATYSYSTLRLLAPLYGLAALTCVPGWRRRREQLAFTIAAALAALPLAGYFYVNAPNLSARFNSLTYLRDPTLTGVEKLQAFLSRYLDYFSPSFLAAHGDPMLRHHTGFGGELLLPTAVLLFVGVIWRFASRARDEAFARLLIADLLLSPIAAALTIDRDHSLRAFPFVIFAIVLSAYGLRWLLRRFGVAAAATLATATAIQAALYLYNYFVIYPPVSARAFENFGFKEALARAISTTHRRVVIDSADNQPYISALFFGALAGGHSDVPIVVGDLKRLEPGDVFIFADPRFEHRDMREGLPAESLYVLLRFDEAQRHPSN